MILIIENKNLTVKREKLFWLNISTITKPEQRQTDRYISHTHTKTQTNVLSFIPMNIMTTKRNIYLLLDFVHSCL